MFKCVKIVLSMFMIFQSLNVDLLSIMAMEEEEQEVVEISEEEPLVYEEISIKEEETVFDNTLILEELEEFSGQTEGVLALESEQDDSEIIVEEPKSISDEDESLILEEPVVLNSDEISLTDQQKSNIIASGSEGNISWVLTEDYELTISGETEMPSWEYSNEFCTVPWYEYRKQINNVEIDNRITSIGDYAFYNCVNLTTITLSESLISIGESAFDNCNNLNQIVLTGDAPKITDGAFEGVIATIYYPSQNKSYTEEIKKNYGGDLTWQAKDADLASGEVAGSGIKWILDQRGTLTLSGNGAMPSLAGDRYPWYKMRLSIKEIVIEEGITEIGSGAFGTYSYYTNLEKVELPKSLRAIHDWGFYGSSKLDTIILKGSMPEIAENAFYGVNATVYYPSEDESYTQGTMNSGGGDLVWKAEAFELGEGQLSEGVTWKLEGMVLKIEGEGELLETADSPASYPWYEHREKIESIELSSEITKINDYAFYGFTTLKEIVIPAGINVIGHEAFKGNTSLRKIRIKGALPEIAENAFEDVTAVVYYDEDNIVAEDKQNYGGTLSWEKHSGLIASGTMDNNIEWSIGEEGTLTVKGEGIVTETNAKNYPWREYRKEIKKLIVEEGITELGDYSFGYLNWVEEVELPEGLEKIGSYAFEECNLLKKIDFPETLTSIGEGAFQFNSSLEEVELPEALTELGSSAFYWCENLRKVKIYDGVTKLGNTMFDGCDNLQEVTLPKNLKEIDFSTFGRIKNLKVIFTGSAPRSIESEAFSRSVATIYYPKYDSSYDEIVGNAYGGNLTWIAYEIGGEIGDISWRIMKDGLLQIDGKGALPSGLYEEDPWWQYRSQVKRVVIGEGITEIDNCAFAGYENLVEVQLPETLTKIGEYAFASCYLLSDINLPDNISTIGEQAFSVTAVEEVILPSDLTSIAKAAFSCCNSLRSIVISKNVEEIGQWAFGDCDSLSEITFLGNAPVIAEDAFEYVNATVYYFYGNETYTDEVKQNYGGDLFWTEKLKEMPSDLSVAVDETTGDIVISTMNQEWIDLIEVGSNHAAGQYAEIDVYSNGFWKSFYNWKYGSSYYKRLIIEDNKVIIPASYQSNYGLPNGEVTISIDLSGYEAYEVPVLITHGAQMAPVDAAYLYDESTGDILFTSSNREWLEGIVVEYNYKQFIDTGCSLFNVEDGNYRMSIASQGALTLTEEGVLLSGDYIKKLGFSNGEYQVAVRSAGFTDVQFEDTLEFTYGAKAIPEDVKVYIDEVTGDIVVESSDASYLDAVAAQYQNSSVGINIEFEGQNWFNNFGSSIDLVRIDNKIIVYAETQQAEGLGNGENTITLYGYGYVHSQRYPVTITHGAKNAPEDITVVVDEITGNLLIQSADKEWIESLYVSDNSSYTVRMSSLNGDYNYTFSNGIYSNNLVFDGEKIIITAETQQLYGMSNGEYAVSIRAAGYTSNKNYMTVTLIHAAKEAPHDIVITTDSNGDIIIATQDVTWLNTLVYGKANRAESGDSFNGPTIYFEGYFIDCQSGTLSLKEGKAVLSSQVLKDHGIPNGTHRVSIAVPGYATSDKYNVEVTHGALFNPEDIKVNVEEETGNIIVESKDQQWLHALWCQGFLSNSQSSTIYFYFDSLGTSYNWYQIYANRYNNPFILEEGKLIIPSSEIKSEGIPNGTYRLCFDVEGYVFDRGKTYSVTVINGALNNPEDIKVSVEEETGNIIIESSDQEWLNALSRKDLFNSVIFDGSVFQYISGNQMISQEGRVIIPSTVLKANGVSNGDYSIYFEISGYVFDNNDTYLVTVTQGAKTCPDDVRITYSEETGDILITSSDREWLELFVTPVSSSDLRSYIEIWNTYNQSGVSLITTGNYTLPELKDEGLVISQELIKNYGLLSGTYRIMLGGFGYSVSQQFLVEITQGALYAPEDIHVSVDEETGDILINSNDQNWINALLMPNQDTKGNSYVKLIDAQGRGCNLYNSHSTVLEKTETGIRISSEWIITYGLKKGQYELNIRAVGYGVSQKFNIELIRGVEDAPEDISVVQDTVSGNVIIMSENEGWLEGLLEVNWGVTINNENDAEGFFYNNSEETKLKRLGNAVVIPYSALIHYKIESGTYKVWLNSYGYTLANFTNLILDVSAMQAPTDIKVSVDSNGNLRVKSSDKDWMLAMAENPDGLMMSSIVLKNDETEYILSKDIVYKSGTLVISIDTLKEHQILNGSYEVMFEASGYKQSLPIEVEIKKCMNPVPEDIIFIQSDVGEVIITTSTSSFISSINNISLSNSYGVLNLEKNEYQIQMGKLIIPLSTILNHGIKTNEEITVCIQSKDYLLFEQNIQVMIGAESAPEDVKISQDEFGNIQIVTSHQRYLESLTKITIEEETSWGKISASLDDIDVFDGYAIVYLKELVSEELNSIRASIGVYSYGFSLFEEKMAIQDAQMKIIIPDKNYYTGDQILLSVSAVADRDVTWSTGNAKIVTIDNQGLMTFKSAGSTVITANAFGKSVDIEVSCQDIELSLSAEYVNPVAGQTVQLQVSHNTDREIEWLISNESVISLDKEQLTVQAITSGNAVLTAKLGNVIKTIVFVVYPVAKDAKIVAEIVNYNSSGMEIGETLALNVHTDRSGQSMNELMEYSSSNPMVVDVDAYGNLTALAKGNVKITATVINDPLKRKVIVPVKVIERQVREINIELSDELIIFENDEILMDYQNVGKGYRIELTELLYDRENNLLSTNVKWTIEDSKVASIKKENDVNVLMINGSGQTVLKCTAQDARKETKEIVLRVREYAPKLMSNKITLNKYAEFGTEIDIYPAYDTKVLDLYLYEYDSLSKTYVESGNFATILNHDGSKMRLELMNHTLKKGNYKVQLIAEVDNGMDYSYEMTINVVEQMPNVNVKSSGYINTFNIDESTVELIFDHKGNVLNRAELEGTEAFMNNFSVDEEGHIEIYDLEPEENGKLNTKGTVVLYYEGYSEPVRKNISLSSKMVKPNYRLESTSLTFNESGNNYAGVRLIDSKTKEVIDLDDYYSVELVSGQDMEMWIDSDSDEIILSGVEKNETVKFEVTNYDWMQSLSFTVNVKVVNALPKMKLETGTITVHPEFMTENQSKVFLDQPNVDMMNDLIVLSITNQNQKTEAEKMDVLYADGEVAVYINDETIKAGSYKYQLNGYLDNGTALNPVTFVVKVDATEPQYKLSGSSVKLNKQADQSEVIELKETLNKNTYNVEVTGMEVRLQANAKAPQQQEDDIVFERSEEGIKVYAAESASVGTYTYYIRPEYDGVASDKEVKISVQVYDKAPGAKVNLKGSLNPIDPEAAVEGTVKLSNLVDEVESASIEHLSLEVTVEEGKVFITLKEGEVLSNQNIKTKLRLTMKNTQEVIDTEVSVKVARAVPTLKLSSNTLNMYDTTVRGSYVGTITLTMSKGNGEIVELISQNKAEIDEAFETVLSYDGESHKLDVYLKDGAKIKAGSSTALKYQVIYKGETDLKKAPSIIFKVTDKSTAVKWNYLAN